VRVRAHTQHLRTALREVGMSSSELGDLGWTDEREVHRPEEDDEPPARGRVIRHLLELAAVLQAHDRLELELWKLVTNGQHVPSPICYLMKGSENPEVRDEVVLLLGRQLQTEDEIEELD